VALACERHVILDVDYFEYGPVVYIEIDTMIQPLTADMEGALARAVVPTLAPYVVHGRVMEVDDTSGFLYIEDPTGGFFTLLDEGGVLTIFDHHDAGINGSEVHTAGRWDSAPSYSSGSTTFTNSNGDFPDHSIGWTLQPDARHSVFFEITGISDTTITVRGDATSQIPSTSKGPTWYFIIPPVGVDKEPQGTPATAALDLGTHAYPSLYLAFHYRYVKPQAGVYVTTKQNSSLKQDGVYGAQLKGQNHQGQYQAWHRMYNPTTGRWTTPDPAAMPWTNLVGYVGENPVSESDPTGLSGTTVAGPPTGTSVSYPSLVTLIREMLISGQTAKALELAGKNAVHQMAFDEALGGIIAERRAARRKCWDEYHCCLQNLSPQGHNQCWDCYNTCLARGGAWPATTPDGRRCR
jgi:RHS repeat-associated protein